jgi:lipoyl(octanoyl) transferase
VRFSPLADCAPNGRQHAPSYIGGVSSLVFDHLGLLDYELAWEEQRRRHAARAADEAPDTVLLLEHPPVYTAGKRTLDLERPVDGTPVIDVDRGGKITWHGPGQLVGYPIVKLPEPLDVVGHVRRLEEALILVCGDLGVGASRVEGRSGVDLRWYDRIVPCGIPDATVTSLTAESGHPVTVADVLPYVEKRLDAVLIAR